MLDPATRIPLTMPTGQIIDVWDEDVSAEFTRDGMDSTATRTILCYYDDYFKVVNSIRGGTVIIGGYPVYTSALFFGDAEFLSFHSVRMQLQEGDTGLLPGPNSIVSTKYARLFITFKQLPYIDGQVSFETSITSNVAPVVIPSTALNQLVFADGAALQADQQVIFLPTADIEITKYNAGTIPLANIQQLIGKVNSTTFNVTDQGASFPAGQVMFNRVRSQKRAMTNGAFQYDLSMGLSWVGDPSGATGSTVGWNSSLYTANATPSLQGTFQPVKWSTTGKPLYATADLNQLYT